MILLLDTCGDICSLALANEGTGAIIATEEETAVQGHAEIILPLLDRLLAQACSAYENLRAIIAVTGPGNFTGLRVGLSVARGLGLGLSIPVVGVSKLELGAWDAGFALEKRRGEPPEQTPEQTPEPTACEERLSDGDYGHIVSLCKSRGAEFYVQDYGFKEGSGERSGGQEASLHLAEGFLEAQSEARVITRDELERKLKSGACFVAFDGRWCTRKQLDAFLDSGKMDDAVRRTNPLDMVHMARLMQTLLKRKCPAEPIYIREPAAALYRPLFRVENQKGK